MATYGGTQRGNSYLSIDPITGEQILHEGDDLEVSPSTQHQRGAGSALLRASAPYAAAIAAPYLMRGFQALGNPATQAATSAASGAVPAATAGTTAAATGGGGGLLSGILAGGGGLPGLLDLAGQGVTAFQQQRDVNRMAQSQDERDRVGIEIQQRDFASRENQRNQQNALRGGLMRGLQDVSFERPEGITSRGPIGGLRPSAIQGREELGRIIQEQAMRDLVNPQPLTTLSPAQGSGASGAILGGAGLGLTLAGRLLGGGGSPMNQNYRYDTISTPRAFSNLSFR